MRKYQKHSIQEMQKLAKKKGGKCLSIKYINPYIKLKWQCREGHIWLSTGHNIKRHTWCPICGNKNTIQNRNGKNKLGTLCEMQKLAKEKEGYCLSNEYLNNHQKLKWRCKKGHEWNSIPMSIKRGSWCPICSEGISERICRQLFNKIFNESFPKKRYNWLLSPKGKKLELDGYNEDLKLAFEYQGIQHYNLKGINKNQKALEYLQLCDQIKRDKCKEKGITLIEVPYTVKYKDMEKYICQKIH